MKKSSIVDTAHDMIVVLRMDQQTGEYENILVTNKLRWSTDRHKLHTEISEKSLIRIETFRLGVPVFKQSYFSMEDFENAVNF